MNQDNSQRFIPKKNTWLRDAAVFCLLFFASVQLPLESQLTGHDLGAQAALEYWTLHAYQYGTEIVQNVGPLGFIGYPEVYTGFLNKEKFLLSAGLSALFIVLVIVLSKKLPDRAAVRTLLICVALFSSPWFFTPYDGSDARLYLLMLCITYILFLPEHGAWAIVLFPVLALLSLAKGTLLIIAAAILLVTTLNYLISKKFVYAFSAIAFYLASLVLLWTVCGQRIDHLPLFVNNMIGFTHGYAVGYLEVAALFEPFYMTALGVVTVITVGIAILARHLPGFAGLSLRQRIARVSCLALEGFILFIIWKHSFVRADGHMLVLFYFVLIALTLFVWLPAPYASVQLQPHKKGYVWLHRFYLLGFFICVVRVLMLGVLSMPTAILNTYLICNFTANMASLNEGVEKTLHAFALRQTQALVGGKSIGYFGFEPEPLIYNNFNYRPMPKTFSFTAWDHNSMEMDAAFYHDADTAPSYLLYRQATIDTHLSSQDDALAQLEIIKRYDPVPDMRIQSETQENMLLTHNGSTGEITHTPLSSRDVGLGEWVAVPESRLPLRVNTHIEKTLLATILRTFYKPPEYSIEYVTNDNATHVAKFMPMMAEDGFLISPLIVHNQDIANALYRAEYEKFVSGKDSALRKIIKFRITCKHLAFACPGSLHVGFETVEGLNLGRLEGTPPLLPPPKPEN